jgi:hypothetical protein
MNSSSYDCDKILNYNSINNISMDDIDNIDDNRNNKKKIVIPKNKAFMILHEDFVINGWDLITNKSDSLIYTKNGYGCDEFIINIKSKNDIHVTVPISNSNISYRTVFTSYFSACEFISMHLKKYEEDILSKNK